MSNQYYYIVYEERLVEFGRGPAEWTKHSAFIDSDPFSWMASGIEYRRKQGMDVNLRIVYAKELTHFSFHKYKDNTGMIG